MEHHDPNDNHYHLGFFHFSVNANDNHSHLLFYYFWRGGASANVKYFFECCPEMCDRFGNQGHSLFLGAPAPVQKRSGYAKVFPAPIIQCQNELVKSFL